LSPPIGPSETLVKPGVTFLDQNFRNLKCILAVSQNGA
jgi:hypothetical protein